MRISVHLIPNAKTSEIVSYDGKAMRIRISAPPIEGRANKELIRLLAEACDCAPSEIEILRGHLGKEKILEIPNPPQISI